MNLNNTIAQLTKSLGPPKPRAAFGQWVPFAWVVRGLVDKGYGISDAVNHVLNESGMPNNRQAFGSLRAAFYKVKTQEWPAEHAAKDEEGFE